MLNKKQQVLLKTIQSQIKGSEYKVIEHEDFLKKFKKRSKVALPQLTSMMKDLQKLDLIDIKYHDENVFCLALTKKGTVQKATIQAQDKTVLRVQRLFLVYTILFSVLAGAFAFVATWLANYLFG